MENLEYINDPQCALGFLRSCLGAPKMVYSLRCKTPSEEAVILKNLTRFKGQLLIIYWEPINKTGIGIRRACDQIKAAYIVSISQSVTLVELITGPSPTTDQCFTKLIDEIIGLSISQLTLSKIQEVLGEVALNKLIENQPSESEKARLLSLSLPQ